MSKHDLWNSIIRCIGQMALLQWNLELDGSLTFPSTLNIGIRVVSSKNPPRYQSKHIIWSLAEVFDIYNQQRNYGACMLKTQIGTSPNIRNLGVISIKSTVPSLSLPVNSSTLTGASEIIDESDYALSVVNNDTSIRFVQARVFGTLNSISRSDSQTLTKFEAENRGLSLVLHYFERAETFSDKGFYHITIDALVFGAQHNYKDLPCGIVRAYNAPENYTYSIGPTSLAARANLPWRTAIAVMAFLPTEMLAQRRGGRWAELTGRIKLDNAYIGKLEIEKGDRRDPETASCSTITIDSLEGDKEGDSSTANT